MDINGLTTQQAQDLLKKNGPNEIPDKQTGSFRKFIKWFISPIAIMLVVAALLSLAIGKVFDFYFILGLMVLNSLIGFWQENKADNAIKKLNQKISTKVKVLRDGKWQWINSKFLVTGDLVEVLTGDIIASDAEILDAKNFAVNESALTGESLPQDKKAKDIVYSGSFATSGMAHLRVSATGAGTYFGKTLFSIDKTRRKSILEEDILRISKFLSALSILAVVILSAILFKNSSPAELATLDLSLVIAGIPISLPTVMTLIIELGVIELAKKEVIVRRLSALEDLANVNLLLTDKTGTLTKNKIIVHSTLSYGKFKETDLIHFATFNAAQDDRSTLNLAVIEKAKQLDLSALDAKILDFTPADSERKRSTTSLIFKNQKILVSVGAPQVIEELCQIDASTKKKFSQDVKELAQRGFRTLAVAINKQSLHEEKMELVGLIALSDVLREDAKSVIDFMRLNSINTIMLTGDNREISQEIAHQLDLGNRQIIGREEIQKLGWDKIDKDFLNNTEVFAEIFPGDKYKLVQIAKKYFVVAVNGDGINDLPAIKSANVGMAVESAVDALKSTADIVLLTSGIAVIKDAIIESRKIFSRVYTYSLYRISESLRLIITITILGLIYKAYPLTPIQLILLAVLNDIPIISLAFDKVKSTSRPAKINVTGRFTLGSLFALAGVGNSLILLFIMVNMFHLKWEVIQTIYFLKLTVSGHMLIYVAHTKDRWFKFLPSKQVILATSLTQLVATSLAITGLFMSSSIPPIWALVVWVWSFGWMQISEIMKDIEQLVSAKISKTEELQILPSKTMAAKP